MGYLVSFVIQIIGLFDLNQLNLEGLTAYLRLDTNYAYLVVLEIDLQIQVFHYLILN